MAIIKDITRPIVRPVTRGLINDYVGLGELYNLLELFDIQEVYL